MKVIGIASENYDRRYICELDHTEIEKFMGLYYGKMEKLKIGEIIDLGRGYDFASEISTAMSKTSEFIESNKKIINAIMNGITIIKNSDAQEDESDAAY
jgi:hypothetical protein